MPLRVIFMGTPAFAVPALEALATAGHRLLVVTQPARPAGRGRRLRPSPVRQRAEALGIELLERQRLRSREALAPLVAFAPAVIAVVAFGLILGRRVLELPRLMPINLHPSPLPALRGVAPIPWTIWSGARRTAVTTMRMDAGVDTGDLLLQEEVAVGARETAAELGARLAERGAGLLVRTVEAVAAGRVAPRPQPAGGASYAPRLEKAHGHLDWSRPAPELDRLVRAMVPWPRARARFRAQEVAVLAAEPAAEAGGALPGTVVASDREAITVATGDGCLRLLAVQPAGKAVMAAPAFARGRRLAVGDHFTSLALPDDLDWPHPIEEAG